MMQSNEHFAALFAVLDQPALLLEPGTRHIVACNPAAEHLWQRSAASLLGVPVSALMRFVEQHPLQDIRPSLSVETHTVELASGTIESTTFQSTMESTTPNGFMTCKLTTLEGPDGVSQGELAVLSSAPMDSQWRQLIRRAEHPACLIDEAGRIQMASPGLLQTLGYGPEEFIGKLASEFVHPNDWEPTRAAWSKRRQQGMDTNEMQNRWRSKAGSFRWFSWYVLGDRVMRCVYTVGTDITDRKRRELLHQETESSARIGGWEIDLATNELYWTAETYRLHDTSPEEYQPTVESAVAFYTEEALARVSQALQRTVEHGAPWDLQLELITAKGRRIQCRAKGQGVVEDGETVRIFGVFQDISEEFKVERALRDSEELLRSILRDMRAGLVAQHPSGAIMFSNEAALEILGLTQDQILGKTSMDEDWYSIHEDGSPFPGETHPAMVALATGRSVTGVIMGVFRPRTQDRVWILIDAVVQHDDNGELLRVLSTFIDITDRKRAEDAARASDAMFRAVYDNAGLGVLLRDADSRAIECNPTFEHLLGHTSEQLSAMADNGFVYPDDRENPRELHTALLDGSRNSYELERRFIRADGDVLWGHVTVSLVRDADGAPRYIVEMIVDITDRKRMENQLLLADRLASLGTMAAGVGHEINNPLTWIIGNITFALDLLQDMGAAADEEPLSEVRAALQEATLGTERVRTIVRDLRLFSRVDDKPGATADPNQVVQSTSRMLGNELKHRSELQLDLNTVPRVLGDAPRIGQILTNLVVNALHALPERPSNQNLIRIHTAYRDGRVLLEVSDNGPGIPSELQSRIFDPFFTTKDIGSGTGLGLSICHSLVTRLGGEIELESEPGRGATFRVWLKPAKDTDGARPQEISAEIQESTRKRILCIDDEASVGKLIARFLRNAHDVIIETDSAHALERLSEGEHYDAIICDLMMPVMSGMEFFRQLQELDPDMAERCGFITGGVFTETARAFAEELPPTHLVRKPFQRQAIQKLINHLMH